MMLPSRLGCPLSLKTPNMGNPGLDDLDALATARSRRFARAVLLGTAQWAVDTRRKPRSLHDVRKRLIYDAAL